MAGKLIVDTIDTDNAFITLNVQQSLIATMNVSGIYSNTGVKMIGANGTVSNTAITGNIISSQISPSITLTTPIISGNLNLDSAGTTGIRVPSANTLAFYEGGVEAARFDSSGNLLVGTTSGSQKLIVSNSATTVVGYFINSNATTAYGTQITYTGKAPNNTGEEFIYCNDTSVARFVARSNGGLANYSANDVNLSDRREKTNFAPAKSYLDVICAIPVQTFNYIDQNMEDDGGLTLGVVAQDVQAVAPELVMESNWAKKDEEPKMRLSIYQTDLQYALMKCIQEQQALITQLTARITALESN